MKRILLPLAMACGFVLAGAALAQSGDFRVTIEPLERPKGFDKIKVSKAAVGAAEILLWQNTAINPDCSAAPPPTLTVLEPPAHGSVRISDEPFFFTFPTNNPRSACNRQRVPGHQAFYTADAGYAGHDKLVLQGAQATGSVRRIMVDIDVR